jgi:hypothetical protein
MRLVSDQGPPVIAVRAEAIFDYRHTPPLTAPWQDIEEVDVVFHSQDNNVTESRVILLLRGRGRYELDLLGLDTSAWKLKGLIVERMRQARSAARNKDFGLGALVDPTPSSPPSPATRNTEVGLGALVEEFPDSTTGRVIVVIVGFGIDSLFFAVLGVSQGSVVLIALAAAFALAGVGLGYLASAYRYHVTVYENGVVSMGPFFTHAYFFSEVAAALVLTRNGSATSVLLKLYDDTTVHLPVDDSWRAGRLCTLINSRV